MPFTIKEIYKLVTEDFIKGLKFKEELRNKPQDELTEDDKKILSGFTRKEQKVLAQYNELINANPKDMRRLSKFYSKHAQRAIKKISQYAKEQFEKNPDVVVVNNEYDPLDEMDLYKVVKVNGDKDGSPVYQLLVKKLGGGVSGQVYVGVQLDLEKGVIISNPSLQTSAIKIADYSDQGAAGVADRSANLKALEEEHEVLKKIHQSQGFSAGRRQKLIKDEEMEYRASNEVHEVVIAMSLFPGLDIAHHQYAFSYGSMTFAPLALKLSKDLEKLHAQNMIHTDLKPANIIWDAENGHVNIVDYGRAKSIEQNQPFVEDSGASDLKYMPPESKANEGKYRYSKAGDVYALGKILAEKFDKKEDKSYLSYDQLILKRFIHRMLSDNPEERPTALECADFFEKLNEKMKLDSSDIEREAQKKGVITPRLQINRELIQLEIDANVLQKEIRKLQSQQQSTEIQKALIEKNKQYESLLDNIQLFVDSLSKTDSPNTFDATNLLISRQKARQEAREEAIFREKNTSRSLKIIAGFVAVGLTIGAIVGAALVVTGVFAPLGATILGGVSFAATIGGGLAFIAAAFGWAIGKVTEPKAIDNKNDELKNELDPPGSGSHGIMVERGLGPNELASPPPAEHQADNQPTPSSSLKSTEEDSASPSSSSSHSPSSF